MHDKVFTQSLKNITMSLIRVPVPVLLFNAADGEDNPILD